MMEVDHGLHIGLLTLARRRRRLALTVRLAQLRHPLGHRRGVAGLHHEILHPQIGGHQRHVLGDEAGRHQDHRPLLQSRRRLEHRHAVQLGQRHVQHQNVGFPLLQQLHGPLSILAMATTSHLWSRSSAARMCSQKSSLPSAINAFIRFSIAFLSYCINCLPQKPSGFRPVRHLQFTINVNFYQVIRGIFWNFFFSTIRQNTVYSTY